MDKPIPEAVLPGVTRYYPAKSSHPGWQMDADPAGEWVLIADVVEAITAAQQPDHIVDATKMVAQQQGQAVAWMCWHANVNDGRLMPMERDLTSEAKAVGWQSRPLIYGDTAPPSAPVGVEAAAREVIESINRFRDAGTRPGEGTLVHWEATLHRALAQQPAAVDALPGNWDARAEGEQKESINKEWAEWVRENHAGAASAFRTCAKQLREALATQNQEPPMTAETDLPPLPEPVPFDGKTLGDRMRDYARANLAELQREVEGLRAEVALLRTGAENERLHQSVLLGRARDRAERLAEALQRLVNSFPEEVVLLDAGWDGAEVDEACEAYDAARAALDQETTNG